MSEIISRIVEGYVAPGRSVRKILDANPGMGAVLLMVLFSYLATAILTLMFGSLSGGTGVSPFGFHFRGLLVQFATFFVYSTLVFQIGRLAGGTGSRIQTYTAMGWHSLVTSFLTPLMLSLTSALPAALDMPSSTLARSSSRCRWKGA